MRIIAYIVVYLFCNEILRGYHAMYSMRLLAENGPEGVFGDAEWTRFNSMMSWCSIFMYTLTLLNVMGPVVTTAFHLAQQAAQNGLYILWGPLTMAAILIILTCRAIMFRISAPLYPNDFFVFVVLDSMGVH